MSRRIMLDGYLIRRKGTTEILCAGKAQKPAEFKGEGGRPLVFSDLEDAVRTARGRMSAQIKNMGGELPDPCEVVSASLKTGRMVEEVDAYREFRYDDDED